MSTPVAPVWKKKPAKKQASTKLTPEQIEMARERAANAGRRYPNLIDNMAIAKMAKASKELP